MYIVGLTGGIASGKSHAANYLVAKGAQTLNCDSLGHESYTKGSASYAKIVSTFGVDVLDANDEIDRRVLGPIVFSDPKEMDKLTAITWPAIRELINHKIQDLEKDLANQLLILEAAVLIEAGWFDLVDEVLVVHTPISSAITRIKSRDNLDSDQAQERINAQISNEERVNFANYTIENSGKISDFELALDTYWDKLQGKLE
ncbi:MAG: dephospho-CoA kinase [Chloroflexi bacterium]|nr:dephospho-CoA kinase [Chloroflexota bacterium]